MKYEACSTFAFCPEICENTELFLIGKANRSSFIQTSGGLSSSLEPLRLPLVHRTGSSQQSVIKTRKSVQLWWEKCQSPSQAEFCPFLDMIKYKAVSNKILVEFLVHLTVEGCTECFTLPKTSSEIRIVLSAPGFQQLIIWVTWVPYNSVWATCQRTPETSRMKAQE